MMNLMVAASEDLFHPRDFKRCSGIFVINLCLENERHSVLMYLINRQVIGTARCANYGFIFTH